MRFTLSLVLGASLASSAAVLPKRQDTPEPRLIDLAPFKGTNGFPTRPIMSVEEAKERTAKILAEAAASQAVAARDVSAKAGHSASTCTNPVEEAFKAGRATSTCKNPEVRVEWRSFPHEHRLKWVKAARCLYDLPPRRGFPASKSLAEDMAYIHQQLMENIHSVGHFMTWHRLFLWHYQELLRNECGYPRELPLPWWDETLDAGNFVNAPLFGPEYYGEAPLVVVKDGKEFATCIQTGAFANITVDIGPEKSVTTPHCLSRAVNETQTAQVAEPFIALGNAHPDFWPMATSQEEGPHAFGHTGVGSVMGDMWASPADPLFYMHHTFTDRNYWAWQEANPANRTYQVGGLNATLGPKSPTTLDSPLFFLGLFDDSTLRPTQDTQGGTPFCYVYSY